MRDVLGWRIGIAILLVLLIAWPVFQPLFDAVRHPEAWTTWTEATRLLGLARNTILLVLGTLALAFPLGIAAAFVLYRTNLPARGFFRFLVVLTLFVPMPLFASGWQATFGSGGWLPLSFWSLSGVDQPGWTPWGQGLVAAIWIHAMAGLPWVTLLAGHGLTWVERDLEEEALLSASPYRVIWKVTMPRCRAALAAAGLWVALQAATEVTVTDMFQVRTFAEEVYTQFVRPEPVNFDDSRDLIVTRAVAVSIPATLLIVGVVLFAVRSWERSLPPLGQRQLPNDFGLGYWRWPLLVIVAASSILLLGIPLASLVGKAGQQAGYPPSWSLDTLGIHIRLVLAAHSPTIFASAGTAFATGVVAASLALVGCWLAMGSRWLTGFLLVLAVVAWSMPGPIIGVGLTPLARFLMDATGSDLVGRLLYYGPSYLPPAWVCLVRFFGCAVVVLWPVVRLLPRDLRESAKVDGATPVQEFRYLIWPLTGLAWLCAVWVVAVLTMGELAASKIVATAGAPMLAHEVFSLMHTGVTNDLAALCLVLLLLVAMGGCAIWLIQKTAARLQWLSRR